ncbi:MAG: biotin--[acetyl-CoA-carboxylase] ligase [Syntrophobacterales bacterium]|nr:biotin--[acetyl-CoA-carboxylase] ligase [Syntrophobacterales bacterium]
MVGPSLLEILRLFKSALPGGISGSELASRFGVTRVAIWKKIKKLQEIGYLFEGRPKQGYRLVSTPDLLHPIEIYSELETSWFGRKYIYHEEVDSTNTVATKLAMDGAPHGTLVVAESQTAGRGRLGRSWMSLPRKGLYFSFILRPPLEPRSAFQLTLLTALALLETLRGLYGFPVMLKWPNDIVLGEKKLAGILAESHMEPQRLKFVVIGVGVNVFHRKEDFTGEFRYSPTSILIELQDRIPIRRQDILCSFGKRFEEYYERFLVIGWQPWIEKLKEVSFLLGRFVTINTGQEKISGIAIDFSTSGGIILETSSKGLREIWIGDIEQVAWKYNNGTPSTPCL